MISPLIPYTIKGAIWYQGEANASNYNEYQALFSGMIDDWRENFKGVQYFDEDKNLIITGAVDDIWFNLDTEELIVVDYKATAKNDKIFMLYSLDGGNSLNLVLVTRRD